MKFYENTLNWLTTADILWNFIATHSKRKKKKNEAITKHIVKLYVC